MLPYVKTAENQFKAEDLTVGWSWRLFVFSIVVFATTVILYAGINFGYASYLQSELDKIKEKTSALNSSISAEDQKNLFNFYSQVYHIQNILNNHFLPSKFFGLLEQNTENKVYYRTGSFDEELGNLSLEGTAASYEDLVKQIEAFRQLPQVKSLMLANSGISDRPGEIGQVSFNLKINLDKNFLKP